nr:hypothetical protein [Nitrosospira sp. Nl5]
MRIPTDTHCCCSFSIVEPKGSEDVEDQFSAGRTGIDRILHGLKAYSRVLKWFDRLDELFHGTGKPIRFPDYPRISLAHEGEGN